MTASLANLHPFVLALQANAEASLSFLSSRWSNAAEWQGIASAKLRDLLLYNPPKCDLAPQTHESVDCGSFVREKISFASAATHRIGGYLLVPKQRSGPLPSVVALHDHGAYYLHGKEKLIALPDEMPCLTAHKTRAYGGRSIADEFAKLGYVVCVIDAFYWGERRLKMPDEPRDPAALNKQLWDKEELLMRYLLAAGMSWMGLVSHDDRRTVDYLLTRPEVDPTRIACLGLSFGGMRTNFLFATDARIKAAVSVGWGCDYSHLGQRHLHFHSVSQAIPNMANFFELTDVMSIGLNRSFMLVQCSKDPLFPLDGMQKSAARAKQIWQKAGNGDNFKAVFYDVPHQFNEEMQKDAFAWLASQLK